MMPPLLGEKKVKKELFRCLKEAFQCFSKLVEVLSWSSEMWKEMKNWKIETKMKMNRLGRTGRRLHRKCSWRKTKTQNSFFVDIFGPLVTPYFLAPVKKCKEIVCVNVVCPERCEKWSAVAAFALTRVAGTKTHLCIATDRDAMSRFTKVNKTITVGFPGFPTLSYLYFGRRPSCGGLKYVGQVNF